MIFKKVIVNWFQSQREKRSYHFQEIDHLLCIKLGQFPCAPDQLQSTNKIYLDLKMSQNIYGSGNDSWNCTACPPLACPRREFLVHCSSLIGADKCLLSSTRNTSNYYSNLRGIFEEKKHILV